MSESAVCITAGIHCTSLSSSTESYNVSVPTICPGHRVGHMKYWKWQGYTVQVQAVLPNHTMYQFKQFAQVTEYIGHQGF
jgi:hypothetical protein